MSDIQEQQASIAITLPDGTVKNVPSGSTGFDIALSIGKRLADDALAVTINGKPTDLHAPVLCDANIEIVTFDSQLGRDIFWHTASHIMAQAIEEIFPGSRFGAPFPRGRPPGNRAENA